MREPLDVARTARLDEYLGAWHCEPGRFLALWRLFERAEFGRAAQQAGRGSNVDFVPGPAGKSVAVVKMAGVLMKQMSWWGGTSTLQLRRDVRQAAADPNVSAILLAIDSPGGTVAGTDDLASEVKAARRKKPVWAHIDDLGASAAYMVASQADMIYANNATALVGSIGTLQVVYDYSAAAEREGVRVLKFATGPLKGAGTPGTAVTEEQAAYFQKLVEDGQRSFDAAVRNGRGMSAKELAAVRTGGVFSADEAQALKLIDGIRPLDRTIEAVTNAK